MLDTGNLEGRGNGVSIYLFDIHRGSHLKAIAFSSDAASMQGDTIILQDMRSSFKSIYGATNGTIILVRPDGYIALIANHDHDAALSKVLGKLAPAGRYCKKN